MSAAPPTRRRRRARRGSLERPISGRTYRGTWLLVAFPLLLAAFTVTRPAPLPRPDLPPAFDTQGARQLALDLARTHPERAPKTAGATGAATWFADQLRPYGFVVRADRFTAEVAGRGRLPFQNLVAVVPGRSPSAIVVVAHRDNSPGGSGANDNASGTAALIELARSYANPAAASATPSTSRRVRRARGIVFLSTDGGACVVRGWEIQIGLVAALLPVLTAAVDLFALTRRRRIPLLPAVLSLRSRLLFWTFVLVVFELFGLVGWWPHAALRPPAPESSNGTSWPVAGLMLFTGLSLAGWLVTRDRLLPRRPVPREEELTGHCAALLALAIVALLVVSLNAFALVFLLPSLHAWLWLPQLGDRPVAARLGVWLAGLGGPALLVWEFADRFGLGLDAPWYLLQLAAAGWMPFSSLALFVVWAAAAGQLAALACGRYAPYPRASERPPLGPIRRTIRRMILSSRAQRRARPRVAPERDVADL